MTKFRLSDGDREAPEFDSKDELIAYYKKADEEAITEDEIQQYQLGYIWIPVEFFLTIKGAEYEL